MYIFNLDDIQLHLVIITYLKKMFMDYSIGGISFDFEIRFFKKIKR